MLIIDHKSNHNKVLHSFSLLALTVALTLALTVGLPLASPTPAHAAPTVTFACTDVTEIPQAECIAVVALYNSTNGAGWSNQTGWLANNTPCAWYGLACFGGHLYAINLANNQLSGSLPPELGALIGLQALLLDRNQLSGSIPRELGALTQLQDLFLHYNHLSGAIPPELGNITSLSRLFLYYNQLSGTIPPELGNFTNLVWFNLVGNQLRGDIPLAICHLPAGTIVFLAYNKLTANDPCIDARAENGMQLQTVPPANVQVVSLADTGQQLTWTPISYTADGGYYVVADAATPAGPYTVLGQTVDKTSTGLTLPILTPGDHYLTVHTFTPPHGSQENALTSDDSPPLLITVKATSKNTPPVATADLERKVSRLQILEERVTGDADCLPARVQQFQLRVDR